MGIRKNPKINANIYIVDHDPAYAVSLKDSIDKPEKYNIQAYHSGERFTSELIAKKFRKNEVHIVFLSYNFKSETNVHLMNGIEILEATKVINPNIEVVMISEDTESNLGSYAKKSGAFAIIPKNDTTFLRLNNTIMRIISQKKLEQKRRFFILSAYLFVLYLLAFTTAVLIHHFLVLSR
ncbi:MAG: response regulator [Tenuifilaceae bacterium]|jgi:DNA-binding NarL/FixJ family response regulator|nr:response regulator [Bacteroidales bacterium]MDI9515654.1 response regulator [Bacteroidota bacterium]NLH55906.1 response regulator [Rikenellaceae bacterium]OQC63259.1 MAG: hypothetical protein BWX49_01323 [Bacteroidetes bacterium ADurb.Bin008]HNV81261.1 response regulator [Tenuifilaceae bacterium]